LRYSIDHVAVLSLRWSEWAPALDMNRESLGGLQVDRLGMDACQCESQDSVEVPVVAKCALPVISASY
jgi:hypothetical protein